MKIILTVNQTYYPPLSGSSKGNRLLAEWLAKKHDLMQVIVPAVGTAANSLTREEVSAKLRAENITVRSTESVDIFQWNGVEVHGVIEATRLRTYMVDQIRKINPDWVLVSSEDPSLNLLDAALKAAPGRVIYLVHTLSFLPFGPQAFFPSQTRAKLIGQVAGIASISQFVADYIKKWSGIDSTVVYWPWYGKGPYRDFGRFDEGYVTMINPCAFKGISIFLKLARCMPDIQFAAVPTWGTTATDITALKKIPNIHILKPRANIDEIFEQTRVLLMPSLWEEAFGMTVMEAQLRGIPVLSSTLGGLPEAKQGTDYMLPVRPIEHFSETLDENMLSVPIVPEQDINPWQQALRNLLSDRALYERQSHLAREAATRFNSSLSFAQFDNLLAELNEKAKTNKLVIPKQLPPQSKEPPKSGGKADLLAGLSPEQKALLMLRLQKKTQAAKAQETAAAPPAIKPISRDDELSLSFAQQRLWFLDQLTPGTALYNEPVSLHLQGPFNRDAFMKAINEIVRRHEILRTNYGTRQGQPYLIIKPTLTLEPVILDLRGLPLAAQHAEIRRHAETAVAQPFDLAFEPMLRISLLQLGETEHIVHLVFHHIAYDAWSFSIFLQELKALYPAFCAAEPSPLKELPIQYSDFAQWQRQWLQGALFERQLSYWKQHLKQLPILQLPTDRPRAPMQTFRGARQQINFSNHTAQAIISLSQREDATLFMTMLTAFQVLLCRYSGAVDISVGSPIANRTRMETEKLIGYFANTLVLRSDLSGNPSFRTLLKRVRDTALDAFSHQDLPFEQLVEALRPERDMSHPPLFQVMFLLHRMSATQSHQVGNLTMAYIPVEKQLTRFDLILTVTQAGSSLGAGFEYNLDLFDESTIRRMLSHFENLIEAAIADPDQPIMRLPMLSSREREQILVAWNRTTTDYPKLTLPQLFEAQVARTPDNIALVYESEALSYRELNAKANQLAHYLIKQGVGPDVIVGLSVERSLEMVIAILGILKAGGAYLPLDPAYPAERIAFMLEDAQVPILLMQQSLIERLPVHNARLFCLDRDWFQINDQSINNPASQISLESLAYVIYTSGSTGKPKGTMVQHSGIGNLIKAQIEKFCVDAESRVLQFASISFDASVSEIFMALLAGARLYISNAKQLLAGPELVKLLAEYAITTVTLPPSVLSLLPEAELPQLQTLITAGESCAIEVMRRWQRGRRLFNAYGPTETTVCATIGEFYADSLQSDIGTGIANTEIYLLDNEGQPVPPGVTGEIYIGGIGLARGYLNRPELTTERFLPNPFSDRADARLYRTGDLACWLPNGKIKFLSRIDHQVKIRGYRIEPGEIEKLLVEHPGVREALVIAREDEPGDKQLVAYLEADLDVNFSSLEKAEKLNGNNGSNSSNGREVYDYRRSFLRVPLRSRGQLISRSGSTVEVETEDISLNGLRFLGVPVDWPLDETVELKLELPSTTQPFATVASVVWRKEDKLGLQFSLPSESLEPIRRCYNHIIQTLGLSISHLRTFLKEWLPEYMIPSVFVLIDRMPMTANGKIDRQALPASNRLRIDGADCFSPPRDEIERKLVEIWEERLNTRPIGVKDNFFDLGGHSLLTIRLLNQIEQTFERKISLQSFFQAATIEQLADLLRTPPTAATASCASLVKLQPGNGLRPFFCVHPIGGGVGCYLNLARALGREQPFYGLQAVGFEGEQPPLSDFSQMASHYLKEIRSVQPNGPYLLGGWSLGGVIAFEMAQQLHQSGEKVALLTMFDTRIPALKQEIEDNARLRFNFARELCHQFANQLPLSWDEFSLLNTDAQFNVVLEHAQHGQILPANSGFEKIVQLYSIYKANLQALSKYRPTRYQGRLLLLRVKKADADQSYGWSQFDNAIEVELVPGDHYSMLTAPQVSSVAELLKARLLELEIAMPIGRKGEHL